MNGEVSEREGRNAWDDPKVRRPAEHLNNWNLMEKDSGKPYRLLESFFLCRNNKTKEEGGAMSKKTKVIAHRRSCKAQGTGLAHYMLMDKKAKK